LYYKTLQRQLTLIRVLVDYLPTLYFDDYQTTDFATGNLATYPNPNQTVY